MSEKEYNEMCAKEYVEDGFKIINYKITDGTDTIGFIIDENRYFIPESELIVDENFNAIGYRDEDDNYIYF